MKRLLRRLSRLTDSSAYSPLLPRPNPSCSRRRSSYYIAHSDTDPVPEGHLPLQVEDPAGDGAPRRFVVPADLLTAPAIAALLRRSAQVYGYEQSGVLRIPCPVDVFQRVLDSLVLSSGQIGGEEEVQWQDWFFDEDEEEQQDVGRSLALDQGKTECSWCC